MTVFFTADTHFSHARIIELCKRPFSSVEEMDETMVTRWNERVKPEDTVYHLGDFTLKGADVAEKFTSRLNGTIHLIWGNHDRQVVRGMSRWDTSNPYMEIWAKPRNLTLCHYAMRVWNGSHHGALMLYGHSHGTLSGNSQSLDVGMDAWDFRPVTLDEILLRMATLPPYSSVDHHQVSGGLVQR